MVALRTAWLQVYNTIKSITDPISPARTKWVYSSFPSQKAIDKYGYPLITVSPPKFRIDQRAVKVREKPQRMEITVFTESTSISTGAKQLSILTQSVLDAISAAEDDLIAAGLHSYTISESNPRVELMEGWKRHSHAFIISFRGLT